jgi:prophage regulatory protein
VERKLKRKQEPLVRKILRRQEVRESTGYSDTQIWRLEKRGLFPERVKLNPDGTAVGWYADEIDEWVRSRVRGTGKRPPIQWRGGPTHQQSAAENDLQTAALLKPAENCPAATKA